MSKETIKEAKTKPRLVINESPADVTESAHPTMENENTQGDSCIGASANMITYAQTEHGPVPANAEVEDELYSACVNALTQLENYKAENFCDDQAATLNGAYGMAYGLGILLSVSFLTLVFLILRDGFTAHSGQAVFQMGCILLPMALFTVPALTLVGNWLDRLHRYRLAEACHSILYTLMSLLWIGQKYSCFAGLELSAFYLSIGKPRAVHRIVRQLYHRVNSNDVESLLIVQALESAVLAELGYTASAKEVAERTLELFYKTTLESKTRQQLEGILSSYIAVAFDHCGELEKALEYYKRALTARLNGKSLSKETLAILSGQISFVFLRLRQIELAQRWIDLALSCVTEHGSSEKAKIEVLANAAQLKLYQGHLDDAEALLLSANAIIKASNICPDLGRVQHLLGLLYTQQGKQQLAASQFADALALRRKHLPKTHVLIEQSLVEYAAAAKAGVDNKAADLAQYELSIFQQERLAEQQGSELYTALHKRSNLKKVRRPLFLAGGVWILFMLISEGLRAASAVSWSIGYLFLGTCVSFAIWKLYNTNRRKALEHRSAALPKVQVGISFMKITCKEWGHDVFVARLANSFNCDRTVRHDYGVLGENLMYYSAERNYDVSVEGNNPICI